MRDAKEGTYNGYTTFCTVNAYGDCPYCDQCNVCHIEDPMEDCEDFAMFYQGDWNFWLNLDDVEGENKMATKIYVLTLEGVPQVAYTDFDKVEDECFKWLDERRYGWFVERDFNYWIEDRDYPNTEEGEEQAWEDYKHEVVNDGSWGDYAWYECYLK